MTIICSQCGFQNSAESKYCSQCGQQLTPVSAAPPSPHTGATVTGLRTLMPTKLVDKISAAAATISGERREVTVLLLDIVGLRKLSQEQGSETVFMLTDAVMKLLAEVIYEYEGHIDEFTGNRLTALFGAPVAHENDPERAIRAALSIQQRLQSWQRRWEQQNLQVHVRIGIHTGPVIIGTIGNDLHMDYTVVGNTVRLATTLAQAAKSGATLASTITYQRTRPVFQFQALPELQLQGMEEKIRAYLPLGLRKRPGRLRGLPGMQIPMIGRADALANMTNALDGVIRDSSPQLALVTGEAGVGKSRLVMEFQQAADRTRRRNSITIFEGSSLAYARSRPHWTVTDLLRNIVGVLENDSPETQLQELTSYLQELGLWETDVWPYLTHLLGLRITERDIQQRLQSLDAGVLQQLSHAALRRVLIAEATLAPTILILEDLHWMDSASWDFLQFFLQGAPKIPLLLVLVSRDQTEKWLTDLSAISQQTQFPLLHLALDVLTIQEGQLLVDRLLPSESADLFSLKKQVVDRAEGNPFYTEEIVRILLDEKGLIFADEKWEVTAQASELLRQVPGTLQGLILARFDKLSISARQTLQRASVLGASFPVSLIQQLSGTPAAALATQLREAENRQFLMPRAIGEEAGYEFRHSLVQEAVYSTLLKRHRRQLHQQAAQTIQQSTRWSANEKVEMLAYHYARSDDAHNAIHYLLAAAENAARRYANEVAVDNYQQVLALIDAKPDTDSSGFFRAKIGLGQSLKLLGKFDKAKELLSDSLQEFLRWSIVAEAADMMPLLVNGLRELADVHLREGNYEIAISHLEAGLEALGTPWQEHQAGLWLTLMERLSFVHLRQGKLDSAFALAHMATTEFDSRRDSEPVAVANLFNTLGGIAWQQGNLEEAIFYVGQCLEPYESLGYTWGVANAYSNLGVLSAQRGKWQETLRYWENALALRQEMGDVHNQAISRANLGQLRLNMGDLNSAAVDLQESLAIMRRLGDNYGLAQTNATLAELSLANDDVDGAATAVNEAIELAEEIGSQDTLIHAQQLQARLLAKQNRLVESRQSIMSALEQAEALGISDVQASCLRVLGTIHLQSGHLQEAETNLRESIELCRQINDPYGLALANLEMGHLFQELARTAQGERIENLEKARQFLSKATTQFATLGASRDLMLAESALQKLQESLAAVGAETADLELPPPTTTPSGERRLAAILLVQLQLPTEGDDEAIFETTAHAITAVTTIVQEYQGQVNRRADGIEAVFGVPVAHEDDAERSVQAAHQITQHLAQQPYELPLTARIGVSYGEVIGGQITSAQYAQFMIEGQPRRQVEQITAQAPSDQVLVTAQIRWATERLFVFTPIDIPGIQEDLWVLSALRHEPLPKRGLPDRPTRFIGRDNSLRQMLTLADNFAQGIGGVLLIEGEPGIGKSRLLREFRAALPPAPIVWGGTCSSLRTNQPFHLFTDLLMQVFMLQPTESTEQMRAKIEQLMLTWPRDAQMTRPYLEMLLGIYPSGTEGERLNRLEPDQLRQQTYVAFRRLLKTIAKKQPVVLLLDDLHWIDPISAELLLFLVTMVTSDPIIFVVAQRRQGADLPNDRLVRLQSLMPGQTIQLLLRRLSTGESESLIRDLFGEPELPPEISRLMVAQSDGNPYFIEEFARMFIEQELVEFTDGQWQLSPKVNLAELTLPGNLESLIRSRVDALPEELTELLRCASVIGRDFEIGLLAGMTAVPDVQQGLERLASRLMISHNAETNRWQFSHALVSSVVYGTMLSSRRQQLHREVAHALQTEWASDESEHAAELSYHLIRAGLSDQAIPYLIMAGERARGQNANEEALAHFQIADEYLQKEAEPDPGWVWRIAVGLGDVYHFSGKYEESLHTLQSALDYLQDRGLARAQAIDIHWRMGRTAHAQGEYDDSKQYYETAQSMLGEPVAIALQAAAAKINHGLARVHLSQGDFVLARHACEQSLEFARAADDIAELANAENLLGGTYYSQGEWRPALHHTTKAMVLREQLGYSWGVAATLSNLGILAIAAGHWHKARAFFKRSLVLRQDIGDIEGVVITHNNLGNLLRDQGDLAEAEMHLRESQELAKLLHMHYLVATSYDGLAEVLLLQGNIQGAEHMIEAALETAEQIGAQDLLSTMHRIQAEILLAQEQPKPALASAQRAAAIAAEIGNRSYEAAGWRAAAAACLLDGDLPQAQQCIDQAKELLADTIDELGAAQVSAQASQVLAATGENEMAEAEFRAARSVFTRLGARLYLQQLETVA